jgi:hypothetical protein
MRTKALFFFVAVLLIAGSATAQNRITWTSQGPPPPAASDSGPRHSGGDGNYGSNGYWCAPAPPLEIASEPASASSFAYGPTSGVLTNDSRSGSFSDYLNAPSSSAAANFATASASPSLGEIARTLRQSKMQRNPGPMVIRQDNFGRLQVCDATGGNCKAPR